MEDAVYLNQLKEANRLGNSLLSGLIVENMSENKKNIKISSNLKTLSELIESYRCELVKLEWVERLKKYSNKLTISSRSLKVGICSEILDAKDNVELAQQIAMTDQCLLKIDSILRTHIKHDQSKLVTRKELQSLKHQLSSLDSVRLELSKMPETKQEFKDHLDVVKGSLNVAFKEKYSAKY